MKIFLFDTLVTEIDHIGIRALFKMQFEVGLLMLLVRRGGLCATFLLMTDGWKKYNYLSFFKAR